MIRNLFKTALVAVGVAMLAMPALAQEVTVGRVVQPSAYTAGGTLIVTVTALYSGSGHLTAFGMEETLPAGLTFKAIVNSASTPDFSAVDGSSLSFGWVNPPSFPATVKYSLDVAAGLSGPVVLSGRAIYRGTGGQLSSPVVETTINEFVPIPASVQDLFDQFDTVDGNGDGLITRTEIATAGYSVKAEDFATYDANSDGFISQAELVAAGAVDPNANTGCNCSGTGKALIKRMYGDGIVLASAFLVLLALGSANRRLWKN